ncbi:hypothetical protein ACFL43_01095 [Thermodesulfobacteriota bacterium]
MTPSETSNQPPPPTCVICGQTTSYPLELNDKLYCSSGCLGKYRAEAGERQFEKDSIATFEKKRDTGWIPERALMYIGMCQRCSKTLKEMCKANQYVSGLNRATLRRTETVPWCCHARFNLSSALSDGTVPLESARKIQAQAERMVKDHTQCRELVGPEALQAKMSKPEGLKGVTTTIIDIAAAETATSPEYKPMEDKTPGEDGEIMIHYAACLECDPVFGAECEEQAIEKDLNNCVEQVSTMTHSLWCEHTLQALSALLLNKHMTRERLQHLIDAAEGIAQEKNDPGINTRHLFIALGRAVT